MIRVLLAEDHSIVRDGIRLLLQSEPDFQIVAEAANGRQAVAHGEAFLYPSVAKKLIGD